MATVMNIGVSRVSLLKDSKSGIVRNPLSLVCPTERKTDMRMTEDRIERIVEREMDKLDKLFLNGGISIERYDEEVAFLDRWA